VDQRFITAVPEELRDRAMTLLSAGLMTIQGPGNGGGRGRSRIRPAARGDRVGGAAGDRMRDGGATARQAAAFQLTLMPVQAAAKAAYWVLELP
jgi:hypothetical protein